MLDMICEINYWINDINMHHEVVKTIEDDIIIEPNKNNIDQDIEFEKEQLIESLLLELLKEDYGENVELINFESVNVQDNLYKITAEDVYCEAEYI
jgi:hypothetical protein